MLLHVIGMWLIIKALKIKLKNVFNGFFLMAPKKGTFLKK